MRRNSLVVTLALSALASVAWLPVTVSARPMIQTYVVRMQPNGQEAERFSRSAWGGGLALVLPVPQVQRLIAGVGGMEFINLLSQESEIPSGFPGVEAVQHTDQFYARFYLGTRLGPHGRGFLRPFVGGNLALVVYTIGTNLVLTNQDHPDEEQIRRDLGSETKSVFGYDLNGGVDLNVHRRVSIEGGFRYLKSFDVPQQLGEGSVRVEPEYLQIFFGVAIPLFSE